MLKSIVRIAGAALISVTAFGAYVGHVEHRAKNLALEFCRSVQVGQNADALLEQARSMGADDRMTRWSDVREGGRWLPVTFTGFTPFSRHICSIDATSHVTSLRYAYLD